MKKLTSDSRRALLSKEQIMSIKKQFKATALASTVTAWVCISIPASYATDIEIYKVPEDAVGSTTLMMMLDTSGSMTSNNYNENRLLELKNGLRDSLQGTPTVTYIQDKVILGLATFSANFGYIRIQARPLGQETGGNVSRQMQRWYRIGTGSSSYRYATCTENYNTGGCKVWGAISSNNTNPGTSSAAGNYGTNSCNYGANCVIYYINQTTVKTHRDELISLISGLSAGGSTPTAYAYADAAAYLMGTTTALPQVTVNVPVYAIDNSTSGWSCQSWNLTSKTCSDWGDYISLSNLPSGQTSTKSCTVRYGNNKYSATCYYYDKIFDDPDNKYSGFNSSVSASKSGSSYSSPSSITDQTTNSAKPECSGQGIYFLTDGEPNPAGGTATGSEGLSGTSYKLMKQSLGSSGSSFNCASSPLGNRTGYFNSSNNGWSCIGKFAQSLLDSTKNPVGLQIKTVVVGFGSDFTGTGNPDVEDAKTWGTLGGGGWVAGSSSQDVVNSINKFIQELNKDIPSMSTGSSTIPTDALNPAAVQPFSYFPQFEPKVNPVDTQQIWFGNLKKYYVLNNSVYASTTASTDSLVVKKSKLQDVTDIWANGSISYAEGTPLFKKGGALSQLPLGIANDGVSTSRNLFTDYDYDATKAVDDRIGRNLNLNQIKYTYTTDEKTKTDTTYARALLGLLGYNIGNDVDINGLDLTTQTPNLRQMGQTLHSSPVLLTQSGKAVATKDATTGKISVGSTGREDYVLFGTSQGIVQVVDADTGVEKFAFVPKEIIEHQSETFKNNGGNLAGGKDALYYGMDGEWTAYTVYITKPDGTLTVKGTVRGTGADAENLTGKQWVYGGMRMGGRSYYALDLTTIGSPKLKFHIDPSTSKVYTPANPSGTTFTALANMGQSWSKPTLGYVNWKGKRKLVMFVGGGYDAGGENGDGLYSDGIRTGYAGYEKYNYKQEDATSTKKNIGAGVYMFDADNGDLLWNADSNTNSALKYSVAAPIRAIDRNNDGIIDHLYFGDLSGQAFRVDFKNDGSKTAFTAQATRILDLHQTDGTSPRFYTLPTFTAHYSAGKTEGGNIVMATFVSGNKSSPLLATSDSPSATGKKDPLGLQYDAAYAIYDYDVYPSTAEGRYPTSAIAARSLAASNATTPDVTKLKYINGAATGAAINRTDGWGGWYYQFNKKFDNSDASASIIKSLTNPIAIAGSLYVTQYDASSNGTTSSCGAGVKGNSFTQRLCLPTGVCSEDANYKYNLGSGIVTLNIGGDDNDPYKRNIVVPDPDDICTGANCSPCTGTACTNKPKFLSTGGALKFLPHRWYERYAQSKTP